MEYILNNLDAGILKIELNRPQKRNALTLAMDTEFAELLNTAQTKPEIRVVLVSAAGDNYSAGNDLQDFLDHPPGSGDSPQKQLIDAIRVFDKPLVGAVRGSAVGSGATMLTYFDFVVAGQSARFQYPFINLALVPELEPASRCLIRLATFARLRSFSSDTLSTHPRPWIWDWSPRSSPMLKSLARRRKSLKSWHRSHWLQSKLPNNFSAVNFDHVWNRLPRTKWWSLAKECARRTLVRRLLPSSRNGLPASTPSKLHSQGSHH